MRWWFGETAMERAMGFGGELRLERCDWPMDPTRLPPETSEHGQLPNPILLLFFTLSPFHSTLLFFFVPEKLSGLDYIAKDKTVGRRRFSNLKTRPDRRSSADKSPLNTGTSPFIAPFATLPSPTTRHSFGAHQPDVDNKDRKAAFMSLFGQSGGGGLFGQPQQSQQLPLQRQQQQPQQGLFGQPNNTMNPLQALPFGNPSLAQSQQQPQQMPALAQSQAQLANSFFQGGQDQPCMCLLSRDPAHAALT